MNINLDMYQSENDFYDSKYNKYKADYMMETEWNQYQHYDFSEYIDFDSQEAIDDSESMYRLEKEF